MSQAHSTPDPGLRAEHDALAERLADRGSVASLRRAVTLGFFAVLSAGLSWALLWDRYGKTPTEAALRHTDLFHGGSIVAGVAGVALAVLAGVALARWRRMAREEERLFARLCELRRALGIDP